MHQLQCYALLPVLIAPVSVITLFSVLNTLLQGLLPIITLFSVFLVIITLISMLIVFCTLISLQLVIIALFLVLMGFFSLKSMLDGLFLGVLGVIFIEKCGENRNHGKFKIYFLNILSDYRFKSCQMHVCQ